MMRLLLGCTLAVALSAGAALAGGTGAGAIYPVHTTHNFCPAGLQPVTMNGEICCGTPNQSISYQQVMSHPRLAKKHHHRSARVACPVGQKGCN